MKDTTRALTRRTSQADPKDVLVRLNRMMHGWATYFRHAIAQHTFRMLGSFLWHRVIMWLKTMHRCSWKDVRSWLLGPHGSWLPVSADGIELINLARTPVIIRYRYRGDMIPGAWPTA
ncbi:group II intron maturase-specific domain-containing protein [Nocardiopsis valliformis]|uniref:group II intron maturase-specific domain-containing protein n=1 Tax=Nocardiopsis valliformis TaxID=239974 RepID=UPI001360B0E8|nr:group II intron maturase-specific domain-containing protein [Nocardiopsis valliformis]